MLPQSEDYFDSKIEVFSQDLRLASHDNERFNWQTGLYFAQDRLDDLISGTKAVTTAIDADPTLGGAAITAQVTQTVDYGVISFADTEYVGARMLVEVYAR